MFGPGRHFPPAELREWERGERLDPEYQLSAKPPSPAQLSPASLPAPAQKSRSAFLQREEEEGEKGEVGVGGKLRSANGPGIGEKRHPRLLSRVNLMGHPGLGVETP